MTAPGILAFVLTAALAASALAAERESEDDPQAVAAAAHVQKGTALRQEGKLAEAEAEFNEAIKAYPKGLTPYLGRGQVRMLRQNFKGAARDFTVYLKRVPNDTRAVRLRMEARKSLTPPDKAGACADARQLAGKSQEPRDADAQAYCKGQPGW